MPTLTVLAPASDERLETISQAARELGCHRATIRGYVLFGELEARPVGGRGMMITRASLDRALAARGTAATSAA